MSRILPRLRWYDCVPFVVLSLCAVIASSCKGTATATYDPRTSIVTIKGSVSGKSKEIKVTTNGPGRVVVNDPDCGRIEIEVTCNGPTTIEIECGDPVLAQIPAGWTYLGGTWTSCISGATGAMIGTPASAFRQPIRGPIVTDPGFDAWVFQADQLFPFGDILDFTLDFDTGGASATGVTLKAIDIAVVRQVQGTTQCDSPGLEVPDLEVPPDFPAITDNEHLRVVREESGPCVGSASLSTLFASNNSFAGNMFDVSPAVDLELCGIDVNVSAAAGEKVIVDVWYRPGTSFGFENSSAGWLHLGYGTGDAAGPDLPTPIDLSGNGVVFQAGQSYGMYVDLVSYAAGTQSLRYTNGGPFNYSNADLSLQTNAGKGEGFSSSTFFPRQWNGTLHYSPSSGPQLSVANLVAGQTATVTVSNATPGGLVGIAYSLSGPGPSSLSAGPCGTVVVDLSPPVQVLGLINADGAGVASLSANVPAGTTGVAVWLHSLDVQSCTLTNSLAEVIG